MTAASFASFLSRRACAASAFCNGDAAPLDALLSKDGQATFHSPSGDSISGAEDVAARYARDSTLFQPGGTSRIDVLHQAEGDLAFWTGHQIAAVKLAGRDATTKMTIRVTEVFRNVDDEWKLIHRHADFPTG